MTTTTATLSRPGWYHGWNIVAVCVLCQVACLAITLNCFSLFLGAWTHDFKVPISAIALSVTLFSLVCAFASPFAGAAADRFPARWVFGLSLAALAVVHIAVGFATAAWQVVALYTVLLPFAISFGSTISAQSVVSRWFVRKAGLAMGLTAFGLTLSGLIFPSLIVWLLPQLGWRKIWWLFGGVIALVILPLVLKVLRDRPTPDEGKDYVGDRPAGHAHAKMSVKDVFSRPNFWITVAVFVPVQCVYMTVVVNLAPLVTHDGFSLTLAGVLISVMSASDIVAKLSAGMLADKLGNRAPLIITSLICAAAALLLGLSTHNLPVLVTGMVLVGLSGGVWTLLASATAAEFGAEGFGGAYGLISAFTPLGSIAPLVVAKAQEMSGAYLPGFVGLAALAVCGAAVGLLLKEKRPQIG